MAAVEGWLEEAGIPAEQVRVERFDPTALVSTHDA